MRKWLARFSFSLMAIAFVLGYQAFQLEKQQGQSVRVVAYYVGAALCLAAGFAGARERHRG
jgi:hypothetical protein